ncbi:MAG: hypothetical protein JWN27_1040 [Candidatus Eremiobacteraeota bacterium]|jgi:hypothetical protein|nr:hypothetical protein [Candidatus Eremiobacteraeota bacterium]
MLSRAPLAVRIIITVVLVAWLAKTLIDASHAH